jgi:hypothetical protein
VVSKVSTILKYKVTTLIGTFHRWDTLIFGDRELAHPDLVPQPLGDEYRLYMMRSRDPAMSSGNRQDAEEHRNNAARNVTFGKSGEHCRPRDGLAYVNLQSFLVGHL